jgi:FAD/FMN-containing dehydrogenase
MLISGWGRYPLIEADIQEPNSVADLTVAVQSQQSLIARGLGRSYGDSSLSPVIVSTSRLNKFLAFDEETGLLTCESGVSFDQIARIFVPRGWFLPVTPGTQHITVGGAIASDVHGKNHHAVGSFTDFVCEIELLLGNGEKIVASHNAHQELFRATCGGMGLTGVILSASFFLKKVSSSKIIETVLKAATLDKVLDAFEDNWEAPYSVAWVDCMAAGSRLGRSILILGEHANDGWLEIAPAKRLRVPVNFSSPILNRFTMKFFNSFYYAKAPHRKRDREVSYERYFYPLDSLHNWNQLYGKQGLLQYQFVVPKEVGRVALKTIHSKIVKARLGSFLAVLKILGKGNGNYLSFPMEGYTMAVDFKATKATFDFLTELDELVAELGGRVYLTKDARMSEAIFKRTYPAWQTFETVRKTYHGMGKFYSVQSKRLGLG